MLSEQPLLHTNLPASPYRVVLGQKRLPLELLPGASTEHCRDISACVLTVEVLCGRPVPRCSVGGLRRDFRKTGIFQTWRLLLDQICCIGYLPLHLLRVGLDLGQVVNQDSEFLLEDGAVDENIADDTVVFVIEKVLQGWQR